MRFSVLMKLAALICVHPCLHATSCGVPLPCARVRAGSILFVGMVVDTTWGATTKSPRDIRIQVEEIFTGIPPDTKEVVLRTEGEWFEKGRSYLIDASRDDQGALHPQICGASGRVTSKSTQEVLDYLHQRQRGEAKTRLTVAVAHEDTVMPDVDVTIQGPAGRLTKRTDEDGTAVFEGIEPGKYQVIASRKHYQPDPDHYPDEAVEVLPGTCRTEYIDLRSDAGVRGQVTDAKGMPVASLQVDLIPASNQDSGSGITAASSAKTDADGRFNLTSVAPGLYLLGSNINGWQSASVPPTYYPGYQNKAGAVPIEVKPGETVDNLVFTLPDFGEQREIQLCVVDETGKAVPSAWISSSNDHRGDGFASLGDRLITKESGCVTVRGYTRVSYAVFSVLHKQHSLQQIWHSDPGVIQPGEGPILKILTLKPVSLAKPKP